MGAATTMWGVAEAMMRIVDVVGCVCLTSVPLTVRLGPKNINVEQDSGLD